MKKIKLTALNIFALVVLLVFQNCPGSNPESPKDVTTNILTSKTEWTVSSVNTPLNSATEDSEWLSFKVSFTKTNMTTSGHPIGASAVWPPSAYTISEDGKTLTRQSDGVVMSLNPITETNFTARFTVPDGTNIGGRIAELGGGYTFNMK